ncbi:MAG: DNA alkylation repair protein [candidate division Zixibacteria bacterium]|nr:DNA alkylation repair protein [candidate division Zixibacteria bacterium]
MNAKELYEDIRNFCRANINEANIKKYSRYFKEGYDAYGLTQQLMHDKRDSLLSDNKVNMKTVLGASKSLIKSGKYEETGFAVILLKEFAEKFDKTTFTQIGLWFEIGISNWAHCDVICSYLIKIFFERKIITYKALADWRKAKNKYQRRAVPVAMIEILKSADNFGPLYKFIDPLMMDPERVVGQGLGWFLREARKIKPEETETFLLKWKNDAQRVIFQYATEKMTKEEKRRFRKEKK